MSDTELEIHILNGPNLNLLGVRDPDTYGRQTLADIETTVRTAAKERGIRIQFRQSNHEGELVDWIQDARGRADGLIINAGAYTHTSIALHDALDAVGLPAIEVHLSNIAAREDFRHISYIAPKAIGMIAGLGAKGYLYALDALYLYLENRRGQA